jgi:hypothetical protein
LIFQQNITDNRCVELYNIEALKIASQMTTDQNVKDRVRQRLPLLDIDNLVQDVWSTIHLANFLIELRQDESTTLLAKTI